MRAITVRNPWAWAIVSPDEPKNVENRTQLGMWRRAAGETIAIHAGAQWSTRGATSPLVLDAYRRANGVALDLLQPEDNEFVHGAIIGTVRVDDVHEDAGCCRPWGETIYEEADGTVRTVVVHLVLSEPRVCEPIPCRGSLGLWTVPDDIAVRLQAVTA